MKEIWILSLKDYSSTRAKLLFSIPMIIWGLSLNNGFRWGIAIVNKKLTRVSFDPIINAWI